MNLKKVKEKNYHSLQEHFQLVSHMVQKSHVGEQNNNTLGQDKP